MMSVKRVKCLIIHLKFGTLYYNYQNKQATKVHISVIKVHVTGFKMNLYNVADYKVSCLLTSPYNEITTLLKSIYMYLMFWREDLQ